MEIVDNGQYEYAESAELAMRAMKRLHVTRITLEYLCSKNDFDKDEMQYCNAVEKSWPLFTTDQKRVFFYYIVQRYTFTHIGKLNGYTQQNASKVFAKACEIIQTNI